MRMPSISIETTMGLRSLLDQEPHSKVIIILICSPSFQTPTGR